jgi:hypothetical protein
VTVHNPQYGTGSHGWVFSIVNKDIPLQGAGPSGGHPSQNSPYRSKLSGLLAVLYLTKRMCNHCGTTSGSLHFFCDNKGTLQNIFHKTYTGISPFLYSDFDLIKEAQHLQKQMPIQVSSEWVKEYLTTKVKTLQEHLTILADTIAGEYAAKPHPSYAPRTKPLTQPTNKITLTYDKSTITSKLYKTLLTARHSNNLKHYIMRKAQLPVAVFNLINWTAHGKAFKCLTRQQQIHTSKLVHQLVHTNWQNHLFYGQDKTCPLCPSAEESFIHVL